MPANKSITITKSDKNQTKSFGEIKFTKAGTYTYKVKETKGSIGGITYDTTEHTVTIEAVDDGKGNIVAKAGSALVQTIEFVNTYEVGLTKGEIKVQKILEGRKWTDDDEFEFTLSAPAGTPMPEEDTITITKDDKDQTVSFGQIVFDEPGKYTYTVKETKGDIKGVTYDTKKHKVTIEVVDDGKGNLVAKDGTKLIQTVKITNTAHKGVKTGDDSNVILYSTTMLGSILAFLFMAIRRRRNRA
jgi:pilin isopeptide linkage protein